MTVPVGISFPLPLATLDSNMGEVDRLLQIHEKLTGVDRGRRSGVEVLNKSCVVLITACWEAFIEDLAVLAFEYLLNNVAAPSALPARVRAKASRPLREAKDDTRVWELAGDGWRDVVKQHRAAVLGAFLGTFNTPKETNISTLFEDLIDLRSLSACWYWKGMSSSQAAAKLDRFVTLRGDIAHRVEASGAVTKAHALDYRGHIIQLALRTTNKVRGHLHSIVGQYPWDQIPL